MKQRVGVFSSFLFRHKDEQLENATIMQPPTPLWETQKYIHSTHKYNTIATVQLYIFYMKANAMVTNLRALIKCISSPQ